MMSLPRKTVHKSDQQNKMVRLCVEFCPKRETRVTGTEHFMTFWFRVNWGTLKSFKFWQDMYWSCTCVSRLDENQKVKIKLRIMAHIEVKIKAMINKIYEFSKIGFWTSKI